MGLTTARCTLIGYTARRAAPSHVMTPQAVACRRYVGEIRDDVTLWVVSRDSQFVDVASDIPTSVPHEVPTPGSLWAANALAYSILASH
jgi:hypothetical protein